MGKGPGPKNAARMTSTPIGGRRRRKMTDTADTLAQSIEDFLDDLNTPPSHGLERFTEQIRRVNERAVELTERMRAFKRKNNYSGVTERLAKASTRLTQAIAACKERPPENNPLNSVSNGN
jgi:hypothetical protein